MAEKCKICGREVTERDPFYLCEVCGHGHCEHCGDSWNGDDEEDENFADMYLEVVCDHCLNEGFVPPESARKKSAPQESPPPVANALDYQSIISTLLRERTPVELALGFARYEALRKLNARQYAELSKRNLGGENFDGMVDALINISDQA